MPFTGKATYSAGATLPENVDDVSDLIGLVSPHDTPLLDALGDPTRAARSTVHEWLEDSLIPNTDTINDGAFTNATTDTAFIVQNASRFRVGDQVRQQAAGEIMLVTDVDTGTNTLTVVRGYGGSTPTALVDGSTLVIVGNASLEGEDASSPRFTTRSRTVNYTQIFSASVEVSGSELAVRQIGVSDELDYQKQQRTRELIRDLENSIINGRAPAGSPEGSSTVRRTMKGMLQFISTNRFAPGVGDFPADTDLSEEQLNLALREIWNRSSGQVDLIVVGGVQKRAINNFGVSQRTFAGSSELFKQQVQIYESDFGVCRVILARSLPPGTILLLDSSRIEVMPLAGRSFHFKRHGTTGDRESGQVIGEYTMEFRNEAAHGVITGLA